MPTDFAPSAPAPGPRRTALVIGGGVIGYATACFLQRAGLATTLVDPMQVARGASWGNAGHIAVEQVEPLASRATLRALPRRLFWRGGALGLPWRDIAAWLPFSLRLLRATHPTRFAAGRSALTTILGSAMAAWRRLLADAGAPDLLREDGHFVVWESEASAVEGRARWQATDTGTATIRDATSAEIASLRALADVPLAGAIRFVGSGQITDPTELADALAGSFTQSGGARREAAVARLEMVGGRVVAVLADGDRLDADAVIVTAGARSGELLRPLGHRVPIIAERGYHIQSAETDWPADMPPVVFEDRSMIVTRFRSGLRAASFVEYSRHDRPPDQRKWARLRAHVAGLGLSFRLPGVEWMGARPTLPDYLPAIGRSRRADNLFYAFGHQHLGLTLAATTGEAMMALVTDTTPPFDLTPFDLDRF